MTLRELCEASDLVRVRMLVKVGIIEPPTIWWLSKDHAADLAAKGRAEYLPPTDEDETPTR